MDGWCPSWVLCSYYNKTGAVRNDWTETCPEFRRKQMPDEIKITVEVNGQPGTLADVSLETLTGMRDKSQASVKPVKPIEHGDYGYYEGAPHCHRLFVRDRVTAKANAFDKGGQCGQDVDQPSMRSKYTITGNIFKDMQNG